MVGLGCMAPEWTPKNVMPQSCGVIVIPDLIGNPEKSMLDSRFRGNDSIEVHSLPTRLRGYPKTIYNLDRLMYK